MMQIRAKARRLKKKTDLRLVVVDYLQPMHQVRFESAQAEVAEFSRSLKLLAKELRGGHRDQPIQPRPRAAGGQNAAAV